MEQLPIEVQFLLLKGLGKKDLLTCRLVSQSWRKESEKHLRNQRNQLNIQNLNRWATILTHGEHHPIRFHELTLDTSEDSLDIIGTAQEKFRISVMYLTLENYFSGTITSLALKHCVVDTIDLGYLVRLLKSIAPSLQHLDLKGTEFTIVEPANAVNWNDTISGIIQQLYFDFPKLTTLKRGCRTNQIEEDFYEGIIRNSRHLLSFKVPTVYTDGFCHDNFKNLESLGMGGIEDRNCYRFLEKLSSTQHMAGLQHLTVYVGRTCNQRVLHHFASSLKSVKIGLETAFNMPYRHLQFMSVFDKVEKLSFEFIPRLRSGYLVEINVNRVNLLPATFPKLHTIELPLECKLKKAEPFESVKKLIIHVGDYTFSDPDFIMAHPDYYGPVWATEGNVRAVYQVFDEYLSIFPNATTLNIVKKKAEEDTCMEIALKGLLASNFALNTRRLEIRGTVDNVLGNILAKAIKQAKCRPQFLPQDPFLNKLQRLSELRLIHSGLPVDSNESLNLASITLLVPTVHLIQVKLQPDQKLPPWNDAKCLVQEI